LKNKVYITVLLSHLIVLLSLFAPIIRVNLGEMKVEGESLLDSYYTNIVESVLNNAYDVTTILMLVLVFFHMCGIANAIYGLIRKGYRNRTINVTVALSFASGLMGALQLYSKSYVLFAICAASFLVLSACSMLLVKEDGRQCI